MNSYQLSARSNQFEFTIKFKLRGNAPKIEELKAKLTIVINEGGNSEKILDIKSQIKELVDEEVMNALKKGKTKTFLKMRDQARRSLTQRMPKRVIMRLYF